MYCSTLSTTPWPKLRVDDEMSAVFSRDHLQDLVKAHMMVSSTRYTGLTRGKRAEAEAAEQTELLLREVSEAWFSPQRQWRAATDPSELAALDHHLAGPPRPGGGWVPPRSENRVPGGWLASTELPATELRKRIEQGAGEKWVSGGTTTAEIQRERYTAASHLAALEAQGKLGGQDASEDMGEEEEEDYSAEARQGKRKQRQGGKGLVEVWHGLLDLPSLVRLLTGEVAVRGGGAAATATIVELLRRLEEACRHVLVRGHAIRERDLPKAPHLILTLAPAPTSNLTLSLTQGWGGVCDTRARFVWAVCAGDVWGLYAEAQRHPPGPCPTQRGFRPRRDERGASRPAPSLAVSPELPGWSGSGVRRVPRENCTPYHTVGNREQPSPDPGLSKLQDDLFGSQFLSGLEGPPKYQAGSSPAS